MGGGAGYFFSWEDQDTTAAARSESWTVSICQPPLKHQPVQPIYGGYRRKQGQVKSAMQKMRERMFGRSATSLAMRIKGEVGGGGVGGKRWRDEEKGCGMRKWGQEGWRPQSSSSNLLCTNPKTGSSSSIEEILVEKI